MNGAAVIAKILKRDGTEFLSCYPRNPLIEASAALDIRPILCRQERCWRRYRRRLFAAANSDGRQDPASRTLSRALLQVFSENVPLLVIAGGLHARGRNMCSQFSAPPTFFDR